MSKNLPTQYFSSISGASGASRWKMTEKSDWNRGNAVRTRMPAASPGFFSETKMMSRSMNLTTSWRMPEKVK